MIMCDKEMASGVLNASAETVYGEKSAFTQTEHNIVAAYLITAGKELSVCVYLLYLMLAVSYKCTDTLNNSFSNCQVFELASSY